MDEVVFRKLGGSFRGRLLLGRDLRKAAPNRPPDFSSNEACSEDDWLSDRAARHGPTLRAEWACLLLYGRDGP
jgi:hypothetical protein